MIAFGDRFCFMKLRGLEDPSYLTCLPMKLMECRLYSISFPPTDHTGWQKWRQLPLRLGSTYPWVWKWAQGTKKHMLSGSSNLRPAVSSSAGTPGEDQGWQHIGRHPGTGPWKLEVDLMWFLYIKDSGSKNYEIGEMDRDSTIIKFVLDRSSSTQ